MKKRIVRIISLFMALCLLMSLPVFSSAAVKGDVNGDGKVTAADARLTLRCSVQLEVFTAAQKKTADINSDSKITAADARTILRMSVGLVDTAVITVQYARNYKGDYSSFRTIRASNDIDYSFPVILSTNADVTEFRIVGLRYSDFYNKKTYYDADIIENCGTFGKGEKIVIYITCLSDIYSEYGIVYKDGDGTEKAYGFGISGYDGSIQKYEIGISAFVTYPANIFAQFARDYDGSYSSFETIYASDDLRYRFPVILSTDADVTDFRIVKVGFDYMSGSKIFYEASVVKNCGTLSRGERVVVYVTNKFDLYPEYGIVYKDTDGKEKFHGFLTSGYDGSLILTDGYISSYTGSSDKTAAKVTAVYGDDNASYPEHNTVYASISSFSHPVIVKTDKRITDFKVLGMDKDASTGKIITNEIKSCGTLAAGESVNIYVTFNTSKPVFGYSYKDADGVEKVYSIMRSTKDASLIITREYNTVKKTPAKISLSATFGEHVSYDYSYFDTVRVNTSSWGYPVILTTNREIKDLKFYSIMPNGNSFEVSDTYNYGNLYPGEPIVVYVYNHDGIPHNAVSYTDENGKLRTYTFLYPVNGAGDKVYFALGNEIKLSK